MMDQPPRAPFSQPAALMPAMMPPMMMQAPMGPPTKTADGRTVPAQNMVFCYNPSMLMAPPAMRMFMPMMGAGMPMMAPPMMMPMMPMMPIPPPQPAALNAPTTPQTDSSEEDAPLDLSSKAKFSREPDENDIKSTNFPQSSADRMDVKPEPAIPSSGEIQKPCYKKNMLKRYQGTQTFYIS